MGLFFVENGYFCRIVFGATSMRILGSEHNYLTYLINKLCNAGFVNE